MDNLRQQWNDTCLAAGIPAFSVDYAAKTMAILLHFGNYEAMVLSPKFRADCDYIQKRWHMNGGETPDMEFVEVLQQYDEVLKDLTEPPEWAKKWIKEQYGINL